MPLIPGVNDSPEQAEKLFKLVKNASALERIELLPYHPTAGAKYEKAGKHFLPSFPVDIKPNIFSDFFQENGIRSVVL